MIMDEEVVQGQRILTDMRIRNELVDRLSRVTAQRQLQRWMDEPLVLECNACGCEGEADNREICSDDLCIFAAAGWVVNAECSQRGAGRLTRLQEERMVRNGRRRVEQKRWGSQ